MQREIKAIGSDFVLLCLDFESDVPIYMQIRNQIVIGIANGELTDGERLPTIRALSNDLGINMMTVSKAYQLLKSEGYIYGDRRNGAVVRKPETDLLKASELSDFAQEHIRLVAAQAKLQGVPMEEFLMLCREIYEASGEIPENTKEDETL